MRSRGLEMYVRWVPSESNPSDAASRRGGRIAGARIHDPRNAAAARASALGKASDEMWSDELDRVTR